MKITKRQLRKVIREAIRESTDMINRETGEVITFGDRHNDVAPDKAVNDIMKRLGISPKPEEMRTSGADGFDIELSNDDFMKVEDETVGKQDARARKRKSAQMAADGAQVVSVVRRQSTRRQVIHASATQYRALQRLRDD